MSQPRPAYAALPPDAQRLFDAAVRSESGASRQRKHHLVPASYLKRWEERDRIRVTEVINHRTRTVRPETAARVTDYYRIESPDIDRDDVPPLLFEMLLGREEEYGKRAIDELLVRAPDEIDRELLAGFVWYLGFQITRGAAFRRQVRDGANDMFRLMTTSMSDEHWCAMAQRTLSDAELAEIHDLMDDLRSGRAVVHPQDSTAIGNSGAVASELGEHLIFRNWRVYRTPAVLVTCDEPVVTVGGPERSRGERAGVQNAAVILFPLAPDALLAMFRTDIDVRSPWELDHAETAEINREIIANASRWSFERPTRRTTLGLTVPPLASQGMMRDGPFPIEGDDRRQVYRMYRPNRWAQADVMPALPVARWWA